MGQLHDFAFFPGNSEIFLQELDRVVHLLPAQISDVGQAFRRNIEAVRATAGLPFFIALAGVQSRHFQLVHLAERLRALRPGTPMKLNREDEKVALKRAHEAFTEQASNQRWLASTAAEGLELADQLLQHTDTQPAGSELLRQSTVLLWGAIEMLAKDLFVAMLNQRPGLTRRLLDDERTKRRIQLKDPIRLFEEFGYDLSIHMGEALIASCKLEDIQAIREVFDVIFPNNDGLRSLLVSDRLWVLYQRRNLIVHRRGVVDRAYVSNTGEDIELGAELFISTKKLEEDLVMVRDIGTDLLKSAGDLIQSTS